MSWFKIALTDAEQRIVNVERDTHPDTTSAEMLVLWLLHHGDTRERAATVTGLGRETVQRYVKAYKGGGLDGLRRWGVTGLVSDWPPTPTPSESTSRPTRCGPSPRPPSGSSS